MYEDPSVFVLAAHRRGLNFKSWGPGHLGVPARAGCGSVSASSHRLYTTPTGNNPGWICDCRQLYLTQELDLLCMGIVVVLTKSFIFLLQKNKKYR